MLTPAQIRAHRFISAVRGTYKADDVDNYFDEVVASYEQAFKENADLIKKIGLLAERVEAYRNDEENIKATLLTAQRTADSLIRESNEKSEEIIKAAEEKLEYAQSTAKTQAQTILDDTNKSIQDKLFDADEKANRTIADASREAQRLLEESKRDAAAELKRITEELKKETLCLEILKKESASFKGELLEKYRQHIEFIGAIPDVVASTIKPERAISIVPEDDSETSLCSEDNQDEDNIVSNDDCNENSEVKTGTDQTTQDETTDIGVPSDDVEEAEDEDDASDTDTESGIDEAESDTDSLEPGEDLAIATEETEKFLSDNEDIADGSAAGETEQENSINNEAGADETDEADRNEAIDNIDDNAPNLFSLRQRAFAQQQESDETDTDVVSNSPNETIQSSAQGEVVQNESEMQAGSYDDDDSVTDDADEDDGFKVYLDNLDADNDSLTEGPDEPADNKGLFETVEYDDDDDDSDDDGNGSHPRFKGFFKK